MCSCIDPLDIDKYKRFKTGLTFSDVFHMLRVGSDDPSDWHKGITRHTVLGKWHQIKLAMWEEYKYYEEDYAQQEEVDLPF